MSIAKAKILIEDQQNYNKQRLIISDEQSNQHIILTMTHEQMVRLYGNLINSWHELVEQDMDAPTTFSITLNNQSYTLDFHVLQVMMEVVDDWFQQSLTADSAPTISFS